MIFCTITWISIGIEKGKGLRKYQNALIDNVFGHRSIQTFVLNQKTDTVVSTFDGQFEGFLAYEELARFGKQICVLGPIAGLFGRQVEQFLINPKRKNDCYILERVFQKSIDDAPVSLKKSWLYNVPRRQFLGNTDTDHEEELGPSLQLQIAELLATTQRRSLGRSTYRQEQITKERC